jgi:hypothetical protein
MRRSTQGRFISSFRVGITTLTDALGDEMVGSAKEIGSWVEIDKCITTS